jgi:hypothetical protein
LKQFGGEADTAAKEVAEEVARGAPKAAAKAVKTAKGATKAPTLDPAKGVDFNKAGGSKAERAAVEAKAQIEGRGLRPGPGWVREGSFEPVAKAASPGAVRSAAHAAERKALGALITGGRAGKATLDDVIKSVRNWKGKQKLSDPQIVASLRDVYGIPAKNAREFLRLLFAG